MRHSDVVVCAVETHFTPAAPTKISPDVLTPLAGSSPVLTSISPSVMKGMGLGSYLDGPILVNVIQGRWTSGSAWDFGACGLSPLFAIAATGRAMPLRPLSSRSASLDTAASDDVIWSVGVRIQTT